MSLITYDLMGNKRDKVQIAIDRLRAFEPPDGYYVAFSGGKDSQCIYHLCEMAGVKFDAHYHVTSVDPPELVRFIRKQYPQVSFDIPHDKDDKPISMWNLIPRKRFPPTRHMRYCCEILKESGGRGRLTVTGVRRAESSRRKNNQGMVTIMASGSAKIANDNGAKYIKTGKRGVVLNYDDSATRRTVEQCFRTSMTIINIIIDWETEDVWEFLNDVIKVPHCELYDQGYERLGCIGCPMSNHREQELERYPKFKAAYLRAFGRMLIERERLGLPTKFKDAQDVMDWYLEKTPANPCVDRQIDISELMDAAEVES